jgi:ABC-type phosphate transport system substrate-binding protein
MVRLGNLAMLNIKTVAIFGLVVLLIAVSLALRQLTAAAPSNNHAQTIQTTGVTTSSSNDSTNSPASAGESLNNSPAQTNSNKTQVTVNGQSIPVPQNGSVSQTIDNNGSTTTVNVQSQHASQGGASNTNSSSVSVDVNSSSSSSGDSL